MEVAAQAKEFEKNQSFCWSGIVFWPLMILALYLFCAGPLVLMIDKKVLSRRSRDILVNLYAPVDWAYSETHLHKPIGIYLHLWSKRFDQNGDQK